MQATVSYHGTCSTFQRTLMEPWFSSTARITSFWHPQPTFLVQMITQSAQQVAARSSETIGRQPLAQCAASANKNLATCCQGLTTLLTPAATVACIQSAPSGSTVLICANSKSRAASKQTFYLGCLQYSNKAIWYHLRLPRQTSAAQALPAPAESCARRNLRRTRQRTSRKACYSWKAAKI